MIRIMVLAMVKMMMVVVMMVMMVVMMMMLMMIVTLLLYNENRVAIIKNASDHRGWLQKTVKSANRCNNS